jgi:hypothetical protein
LARLTLIRPPAAGGSDRPRRAIRSLRRPFGIGLALVSLVCAACGHSGSTTPAATPTPSPTSIASGTVLTAACNISTGQAYQPDNGVGLGFTGVQVARFQDTTGYLCSNVPARPTVTTFSSSVGGLAFAPDTGTGLSVALALLLGPGGYRYAQDVFQADIGQIVPIGTAYDLGSPPTPAPGTSPSPVATAQLITDASSVAIIGSFTQAVGLITGPGSQGIVALTSLSASPPQYGSSVPFAGGSYTLKPIPPDVYSVVRAAGSGTVVLIRGVHYLVSFAVTQVATGYQFNAEAEDPNLGFGATVLRGTGAIAMDSSDSARALVGTGNVVTLVTGLPSAITETAHLTVPGTTIRAIRIGPNGLIAAVATDVGVSILTGVNGSTLSLVSTFTATSVPGANQLPFVNCAGQAATMTNVYGIGFSSAAVPSTSNDYLVALGSSNPAPATGSAACVYPASVVAIPFNPATGATPTPAPTTAPSPGVTSTPNPKQFTQNNMLAPPSGVDDFFVH